MGALTRMLPENAQGNRNAIFFAISDTYSFAVANIIMGLNRYSVAAMKSTDIIIYHNGISNKNAELLSTLHRNTYFIKMQFPAEWEELIIHPKTAKWGEYVICKFFGFELIKKYKRVLHLDADMHIQGDITELFRIAEEMAWRSVVAWKPNDVFADVLKGEEDIKCGNGGLLLFTDKLLKYNIDEHAVRQAFEDVKNLKTGGIDETVIAWLVHKKGIVLKEIDISVYNTPSKKAGSETRLIHFLDANAISSKPWINLASYLYYEDWAENYRQWLSMGGEGLVHFNKEDYYGLFAYDKGEKIQRLNKKIASISPETEALRKELELIKQENAELKEAITVKDESILKLEEKLNKITGSKIWMLTKPLRRLNGTETE